MVMESQVDGVEKDTKVFEVIRYRLMDDCIEGVNHISATVKLRINGQETIQGDQGVGPVHALDNALRKCFGGRFPELDDIHLINFKVVNVNGIQDTSSRVQVTISFADQETIWEEESTSENIIKASFDALVACYRRIIIEKCSMELS